ncbi:MAG: ribosome assembly RNA-binding protein YhbY [Gammaproteobacteria bacterium]
MNGAEKKKLRAEAHALKPVILIGQAGFTAAVLTEIESALDTHELIKVKIRAERIDRQRIADEICAETGAELIQTIGQIAVIYRQHPEKRLRAKK